MDNLKVNYKDAVFPGNRKYQEISNGDGTVSFSDVTTYTQEGDRFGAIDINATNSAINSVVATKTATFSVGGWTGTAAPYQNTIYVSGITASDSPIIALNLANNTTSANAMVTQQAWSFINAIVSGNGSLTAYANKKPTVNLPIIIKGV